MIVVADSSVLIALSWIDQLDLLPRLFDEVLIPSAVAEEIDSEDKPGSAALRQAEWLKVVSVSESSRLDELMRKGVNRSKLHRGEAEAIVLAVDVNARYLLIDERRGRKMALRYGLDIIGVLGVLALAKRKELLSEIRGPLDDLVEAGFRISDSLYHSVLAEAGEAS